MATVALIFLLQIKPEAVERPHGPLPISIDLRDTSLRRFIEEVGRRAKITIFVDSEVQADPLFDGWLFNVRLKEVLDSTALNLVLKPRGLMWERTSEGVRVRRARPETVRTALYPIEDLLGRIREYGQQVPDPEIGILNAPATVMDTRPVVSSDRRYVTLTMGVQHADLVELRQIPIPFGGLTGGIVTPPVYGEEEEGEMGGAPLSPEDILSELIEAHAGPWDHGTGFSIVRGKLAISHDSAAHQRVVSFLELLRRNFWN
jgi:hypothetical protein